MKRTIAKRLVTYALIFVGTLPLGGYAVLRCGNIAVRPLPKPITLRANGCSIPDLAGPVGRSATILPREGSAHWTTFLPPPNAADPCLIHHNDGTWDLAIVARGSIDGLAGGTLKAYEHCPDSHIVEADIMVASDLDFNEADQRRFLQFTSDKGSGRQAMLHEYGHALGLEHADDAFGVMRSSGSLRMPLGGANQSGSPHYFLG